MANLIHAKYGQTIFFVITILYRNVTKDLIEMEFEKKFLPIYYAFIAFLLKNGATHDSSDWDFTYSSKYLTIQIC